MKNFGRRILATAAAFLGFAGAAHADSVFLHYNVDTAMTVTNGNTNATVRVRAFVKQQGNSDHQRLVISVAGLDPQTPYTLLAQVGDDPSNTVSVATFTTTRSGAGKVSYFQNRALKGHGHNGHGSGVNKHALPDSINPLSTVRVFSVADTNGVVLLTASMHESASLAYEMAATFVNTGNDPNAIGCMAVAIQEGQVQFRLFAAGQSSEYGLMVNGAPVADYFTDYTGRINVGVFPSGAPSPLKFQSVAMRNAARAVVLESVIR